MKPISKQYFVRIMDQNRQYVFAPVEGKAVVMPIAGDFFVHKPAIGTGWTVSEGQTGAVIATGKTRKDAILVASNRLEREGKEKYERAVRATLLQYGYSPRYKTPKTNAVSNSKSVQLTQSTIMKKKKTKAKAKKSVKKSVKKSAAVVDKARGVVYRVKAKKTTKSAKRGSTKTKAEIEKELRAQGFRKERKIKSPKLKKAQNAFAKVNEEASRIIYSAGVEGSTRPPMKVALKEASRKIYRSRG
jgi:hypothetical protein